MRRIGIAGKIGSGKSTLACFLAENGWSIVQADELGHIVLDEKAVRAELAEKFGPGVIRPDGGVDRNALLQAALAAKNGMDFVNVLTWPRIAELIPTRMKGEGPVALEAAVMLQAGWRDTVEKVIVVCADRSRRLERLRASGRDMAVLERLMDIQDGYERMEEGADWVIENNDSKADFVERLIAALSSMGYDRR